MDEFDYEDAILRMQEENDVDVQQVLTEDEKEALRQKYNNQQGDEMTLNNNKYKRNDGKHMLLVNSPAWFALQRAKITELEKGNLTTLCKIASDIICDALIVTKDKSSKTDNTTRRR